MGSRRASTGIRGPHFRYTKHNKSTHKTNKQIRRRNKSTATHTQHIKPILDLPMQAGRGPPASSRGARREGSLREAAGERLSGADKGTLSLRILGKKNRHLRIRDSILRSRHCFLIKELFVRVRVPLFATQASHHWSPPRGPCPGPWRRTRHASWRRGAYGRRVLRSAGLWSESLWFPSGSVEVG